MTEKQNVMSYGRGSLGARVCERDERMWCSACRRDELRVVRINIDGVWSYLCAECFDLLARFVRES